MTFTISNTTLQLASISTVSQPHVIFKISSTKLLLASITTVNQLHVIFLISSTTLQLASIRTLSQLHVLFSNSSTTLQLTSMKTVCQIHVMLRNSSRNTAAGLDENRVAVTCHASFWYLFFAPPPPLPMWRSVDLCWFQVCVVRMIVLFILLLTWDLSCFQSITFRSASDMK
jgi:hypothetical protein